MTTQIDNSMSPPSGGIIGIAGVEDKLFTLRLAAAGTLSNTEADVSGLLLETSNCQCINVWVTLTIGDLDNWSLFPVHFNGDGSTAFRPFSWAYNTVSDWWDANAPVEYNMTTTATHVITMPTYGASFMKLRHSSTGTITSSSALIKVSRNYNMLRPYIADPA